jgi:hypothetical protein
MILVHLPGIHSGEGRGDTVKSRGPSPRCGGHDGLGATVRGSR